MPNKLYFLTLALALIFGTANIALAQWAPPTQSPPLCAGCLMPVNTSATGQTKIGNLTVWGFGVDGDLLIPTNPYGRTASAGQVLTSVDATGLATWAAPGGGFWSHVGNALYPTAYSTDSVGIGTNAPNNLLQVLGLINFPNAVFGTFLGYQAGNVNSTGARNTAVGYEALLANTTANDNTAVGHKALHASLVGGGGGNNTAVGSLALTNNTSSQNTAVGVSALGGNVSGSRNTAVGYSALIVNSGLGANDNVAVGWSTLSNNTSGISNTAIGTNAGAGNASFPILNRNVLVGFEAGRLLQTGGDNNTLLGYQAGDAITTGAQNIVIGNNIDAPVDAGSSQLTIGNLIFGTGLTSTGKTISTGNVGIGTTTPAARMDIYGGGVRLDPGVTARPACTATLRGEFWVTKAGIGAQDGLAVCIKYATELYNWQTIF